MSHRKRRRLKQLARGKKLGVTDVVTEAVTIPQTPSEWLLARYDRERRRSFGPLGDGRRIRHDRGSNFDRRMFDVLDDHPWTACELDTDGDCIGWSGAASWPVAMDSDDFHGNNTLEQFEEIA